MSVLAATESGIALGLLLGFAFGWLIGYGVAERECLDRDNGTLIVCPDIS